MSQIWISRVKNQVTKRLKYPNTKIGYHWQMLTKDDQGRFKSKRISSSEAYKLRAKYFLFGKNKAKTNDNRILVCDKCGMRQENIGQKGCIYCEIR